jgi:hypothetical protein
MAAIIAAYSSVPMTIAFTHPAVKLPFPKLSAMQMAPDAEKIVPRIVQPAEIVGCAVRATPAH